MSKICQITGKKAMVGNNVSHSKRRTKRTFDVNLFSKKFYYVEQDCWITLKVSAAGLRLINKVGLDATPKDCMRIFDINLRQNFYSKEIIQESLQRANVMKINDEELVILGRMFGYPGMDFENKCWLILGKYNLDMLVLTCGVNGSYVFSKGAMSYLETPKVEVADTVGAGDSFTGSFVASILAGKPIAEAHRIGVNVSAYVCTQNGAMPVIPEELKK